MNTSKEFKVGKHSIGYISNSFETRFPDQSFEPVTSLPRAIILPREMNDEQIESELRPGICTLGDVVAVLDSEDPIYKDGKWNLFYFPTCVVDVLWDSFGGEWSVSTWVRGGSGWREGNRVCSPASGQALEPSVTPGLTLESLDARLKKVEEWIDTWETADLTGWNKYRGNN